MPGAVANQRKCVWEAWKSIHLLQNNSGISTPIAALMAGLHARGMALAERGNNSHVARHGTAWSNQAGTGGGLDADWQGRAELEWISHNRQCRQLVAWFGELAKRQDSGAHGSVGKRIALVCG